MKVGICLTYEAALINAMCMMYCEYTCGEVAVFKHVKSLTDL